MNNTNGTVDLHTHSTFSDGTFSPEELVKKAVEKGLYFIPIIIVEKIYTKFCVCMLYF